MRTHVVLFALLLFSIKSTAGPVCGDLFSKPLIESTSLNDTPENVLEQLYTKAKVLGLANPDHDRPSTFTALAEFLKLKGQDPELKTISLEVSHDLKDFMARASLTAPTSSDELAIGPWNEYLHSTKEPAYVMDVILPLVRELNRHRLDNPILVIPIDSVTATTVMNFDFLMSVSREEQTAANFETDVRSRWPNRKHLIVYQHAHLLRNLTASGVAINDGAKFQKTDVPLGWIDYAKQADATLDAELKIAFFDKISEFNPSGAIDRSSPNLKFNDDSFLKRYRDGSVRLTDPTKSIADAYIWTN